MSGLKAEYQITITNQQMTEKTDQQHTLEVILEDLSDLKIPELLEDVMETRIYIELALAQIDSSGEEIKTDDYENLLHRVKNVAQLITFIKTL